MTNLETRSMFANMFKGWFNPAAANYNRFISAMVSNDIEAMNLYMNRVALETFSYFDVGGSGKNSEPEKFYHGFVLGLMAEQTDSYEVHSNRESGFGRYDVMLIPKKDNLPAIVMEFKIHSPNREKSLSDTAKAALRQIEEKNYDAELLDRGIEKQQILHYGFAFEGKQVLIM